jgi:hypothetical protein
VTSWILILQVNEINLNSDEIDLYILYHLKLLRLKKMSTYCQSYNIDVEVNKCCIHPPVNILELVTFPKKISDCYKQKLCINLLTWAWQSCKYILEWHTESTCVALVNIIRKMKNEKHFINHNFQNQCCPHCNLWISFQFFTNYQWAVCI